MGQRFEAVYTDEQRDAVASAFNDRGIRPARRIAAMAAAGELDGLDPFTIPVPSVLDLARKQRTRRGAEHTSELSKQPPKDAVELLRRRIVNVADRMVADLEKQKPGQVDPDRVRQAARAIRECAAIPGPTDHPPARPGRREPDGKTPEGATRSGPVGDLLRAARQGPTAPDADPVEAHRDQDADDTTSVRAQQSAQGEGAPDIAAQLDTDHDQPSEHASPGEWARARMAEQPGPTVVGGGGSYG